jgi:hypothetical protein
MLIETSRPWLAGRGWRRLCPSYCDPPVRTGRNNALGIDGARNGPAWVECWHATLPFSPRVRAVVRTIMAKAGRWLAAEHPEITDPARALAVPRSVRALIGASRRVIADEVWSGRPHLPAVRSGEALAA